MGFIPQITCRHCGKKFSGIYGRCPHCGTRRVKQTSRTPATTNSVQQGTAANERANYNARWQMIFGAILVVAVVVAVIVLITSSLDPSAKEPEPTPPETTPIITTPPPTDPPETPDPTPYVTSIVIVTNYNHQPISEFTQRIEWAPTDLDADIYPTETIAEVTWRSSDESIVTVDEDGVVTAVGSGWAEVIAECGAVAVKCRVYVP